MKNEVKCFRISTDEKEKVKKDRSKKGKKEKEKGGRAAHTKDQKGMPFLFYFENKSKRNHTFSSSLQLLSLNFVLLFSTSMLDHFLSIIRSASPWIEIEKRDRALQKFQDNFVWTFSLVIQYAIRISLRNRLSLVLQRNDEIVESSHPRALSCTEMNLVAKLTEYMPCAR